MPLVELEDRELTRLRQIERDYGDAANWRKTWGDLVADPSFKMSAWELFKKKYPDVPVPEYDAAQAASKPILDEIAALKKQMAEDKEARAKEDAERVEKTKEQNVASAIEKAKSKLRADGWDEEGVGKIVQLMIDRNVPDFDVAAAYVRSQMPKTAPLANSYEGRELNWFNPGDDEPDAKLLIDNPKKYKSDMIKKFMADKASGDLRAWAT
jgi:hypothetical protein